MEKSDESRTRRDEQTRKYSKMDRIGRDKNKGKTHKKMKRGSRKSSTSAGSEKMDRVGGR